MKMEAGFKERLREYIDAQVPIIYIESFDDNQMEENILEVTGRRLLQASAAHPDRTLHPDLMDAGMDIRISPQQSRRICSLWRRWPAEASGSTGCIR